MISATMRRMLPDMQPTYRKIASYILDHEQSVAFSSIYSISAAIGVSNASMVRFSKALGLGGYQDFKREIQDEIRHRLTPCDQIALQELDTLSEEKRLQKLFINEVNNLRTTFDTIKVEDLQAAAKIVRDARKIFLSGFGATGHIVRVLEYTLLCSIEKEVRVVSGSVSDYSPILKAFGPDDVMFIMTFPPYSDEVRHVAKVVKDKGGTLILFTDSAACPIYSMADTVIRCSTNSLLLSNSYVGLISIINILIHEIVLSMADTSIASRTRTIAMMESGYAAIQRGGEQP